MNKYIIAFKWDRDRMWCDLHNLMGEHLLAPKPKNLSTALKESLLNIRPSGMDLMGFYNVLLMNNYQF